MATTTEPFVSSEELAEFLGKPRSWINNNAGPLGIPRYKLGQQWRYRISEVAEWLDRASR